MELTGNIQKTKYEKTQGHAQSSSRFAHRQSCARPCSQSPSIPKQPLLIIHFKSSRALRALSLSFPFISAPVPHLSKTNIIVPQLYCKSNIIPIMLHFCQQLQLLAPKFPGFCIMPAFQTALLSQLPTHPFKGVHSFHFVLQALC